MPSVGTWGGHCHDSPIGCTMILSVARNGWLTVAKWQTTVWKTDSRSKHVSSLLFVLQRRKGVSHGMSFTSHETNKSLSLPVVDHRRSNSNGTKFGNTNGSAVVQYTFPHTDGRKNKEIYKRRYVALARNGDDGKAGLLNIYVRPVLKF